VTPYELKSKRILLTAVALTALGALALLVSNSPEAAVAFTLAAAVSVGGLYILARGIAAFTHKRPGGFTALLFLSRLFLYAFALSAMMKVYPGQATPIAYGICVAIAAIILEALLESLQNGTRT
jgi:hypothetical protein